MRLKSLILSDAVPRYPFVLLLMAAASVPVDPACNNPPSFAPLPHSLSSWPDRTLADAAAAAQAHHRTRKSNERKSVDVRSDGILDTSPGSASGLRARLEGLSLTNSNSSRRFAAYNPDDDVSLRSGCSRALAATAGAAGSGSYVWPAPALLDDTPLLVTQHSAAAPAFVFSYCETTA